MDRYLLFGGEYYYPRGGFCDFISENNDKRELINEAKRNIDIEWFHIVDTKDMNIIFEEEK